MTASQPCTGSPAATEADLAAQLKVAIGSRRGLRYALALLLGCLHVERPLRGLRQRLAERVLRRGLLMLIVPALPCCAVPALILRLLPEGKQLLASSPVS